MTQSDLTPLMERFVRAMISGANRRGYDTETVFKALEVPLRYPIELTDIPPTREQLDLFRRDVASARLSREIPDLSQPLDVTPTQFVTMQRNIKWLLRDDFYGLTRNPCKIGTFLFMIEMIMNFDTLGEALGRAIRFYRLITDDVSFSLTRSDPFAELRIQVADPELEGMSFLTEWQLIQWHRFSCWLLGKPIPVTHAEFSHRMLSPLEEYQRIFSKNCTFERRSTLIRFYSRYLDNYNVRKHTEFQDFMADRFDLAYIYGVDSPLASRIEAQLENHFTTSLEFTSMEEAASEYNISSQTLRRRLEEEGTSYRQIKDNIRRKVAIKWLRDRSIPVAEVARLSGFADANGLSRAVKVWTGSSPSEFRARECVDE